MLRTFLIICYTVATSASCAIQHKTFWSCALKDHCINAFQLHAKLSHTKSMARPFILAIEGPRYQRLYQDCDHDKDGCIDLHDIIQAGTACKRSCIWRSAMYNLLCPLEHR
jgi:hypothetical protein